MIKLFVFYPKTSESRFDYAYYLDTHMPLVRARWTELGLTGDEVLQSSATLDGSPCPYELITLLTFGSVEDLHAALAASGDEIMSDVPHFTNVQPLIQISKRL